jgi:hypothetical protein
MACRRENKEDKKRRMIHLDPNRITTRRPRTSVLCGEDLRSHTTNSLLTLILILPKFTDVSPLRLVTSDTIRFFTIPSPNPLFRGPIHWLNPTHQALQQVEDVLRVTFGQSIRGVIKLTAHLHLVRSVSLNFEPYLGFMTRFESLSRQLHFCR